MSHLSTLHHANLSPPSLALTTPPSGMRFAWPGEILPRSGAMMWYDSVRRWFPFRADEDLVYSPALLSQWINQRLVCVPTFPG